MTEQGFVVSIADVRSNFNGSVPRLAILNILSSFLLTWKVSHYLLMPSIQLFCHES